MNIINRWLNRESDITIRLTIISGILLAISLSGIIKTLNFDFAWGAIILSGAPIFYNSLKKLILFGNIRAGLLISLALLACIIVGEYFAAGEIVFIMMIGELLEDYTVNKARAGLEKLVAKQPATARISKNGITSIIPADQVQVGDQVRINSGETIPVDGMIISGQTTIDQSIITGESIPIAKKAGDEVFCATTNHTGSILIEVTKVGANSSLAKMIKLIKDAETKKAPIIRVMDNWASKLVIIAVILAVVVTLITGDIIRGITVLVVFCPCALVLATPTAIAAGIGNATKHGIIIKSGAALEQLAYIDRLAFDKTGTLTIGQPEVKKVIIDNAIKINDSDLLKYTASAQLHSEHPLGKAIIRRAKLNELPLTEPENITIIPGKGISAIVHGKQVIAGNSALLAENNITLSKKLSKEYSENHNSGDTVVIIAIDNKAAGIITLADKLRSGTKELITHINKFDKTITLLTGDNKVIARKISHEAGINEYQAELLPEDKVAAIEVFNNNGEKVCMVGDGINDAPALKRAHIGIAMAKVGSDIAAESSDIVFMKDELSKLPYILSLASKVKKKIRQNIQMSLFLNFTAIALAGIGILDPVSGALAHNASSILVVLNAATLLKNKE